MLTILGVISGIGKGVIGAQFIFNLFGRLLENLSYISVASSTGLLLKTIGLKIRCLL